MTKEIKQSITARYDFWLNEDLHGPKSWAHKLLSHILMKNWGKYISYAA